MVSLKVARGRRFFRKAPYFDDSNLHEIRPILIMLILTEDATLSPPLLQKYSKVEGWARAPPHSFSLHIVKLLKNVNSDVNNLS